SRGRVTVHRSVVFTLLVAGCHFNLASEFHCQNSSECVLSGVQGTCEATGLCSFPDPTCCAGRRYGAHDGIVSSQCVSPDSSALGGDGMPLLVDDFEELPLGLDWHDGEVHGNWQVIYTAFGQVGIETDGSQVLALVPLAPASATDVHDAVVNSTSSF